MSESPYWTAKELAERLGTSRNVVYTWMRGGKIPYIQLPSRKILFDKAQISAWLAGLERVTLRQAVASAASCEASTPPADTDLTDANGDTPTVQHVCGDEDTPAPARQTPV